MDEIPQEDAPLDVELDRERHLRVHWADGTTATFALESLRVNCPCAECRGKREQGRVAWPGPGAPQPLQAVDAKLVGNFGITITWNDGHATGIYAWGLLRVWTEP